MSKDKPNEPSKTKEIFDHFKERLYFYLDYLDRFKYNGRSSSDFDDILIAGIKANLEAYDILVGNCADPKEFAVYSDEIKEEVDELIKKSSRELVSDLDLYHSEYFMTLLETLKVEKKKLDKVRDINKERGWI